MVFWECRIAAIAADCKSAGLAFVGSSPTAPTMIYTSYFANVKNLPQNIVPISICGKAPEGWEGLQYKKLAPKWSFFSVWKETHDNDYYIKNFNELVLDMLNPSNVINELHTLANSEDICLICYETPEKFCHRHLVANWLSEAGYPVEEYKEPTLF